MRDGIIAQLGDADLNYVGLFSTTKATDPDADALGGLNDAELVAGEVRAHPRGPARSCLGFTPRRGWSVGAARPLNLTGPHVGRVVVQGRVATVATS